MGFKIYLRKVMKDNGRFGVEAFRDQSAQNRVAYWPWWRSDMRYKSVMLNCCRWRIEWLDPLGGYHDR